MQIVFGSPEANAIAMETRRLNAQAEAMLRQTQADDAMLNPSQKSALEQLREQRGEIKEDIAAPENELDDLRFDLAEVEDRIAALEAGGHDWMKRLVAWNSWVQGMDAAGAQ